MQGLAKVATFRNVVINKDDLKHWKCEDEENLAMEVFIQTINLTKKVNSCL